MFISFQVQLARFALRGVPSSVVKWMAIDLIQRGYESPQLDDLAWEPVGRDSAPKFIAAAKSIGLKIPSREEAETILLRHFIERIANTEAQTEAAAILEEMWREVLHGREEDEAMKAHDVAAFIRAWRSQADRTAVPETAGDAVAHGNDALTERAQHLRESAAAWLQKHA